MTGNTDTLGWTAVPGDSFQEQWPEPIADVRQRFAGDRRGLVDTTRTALTGRLPALDTRPLGRRVETYWQWFAVALFLLITVDMVTTMYAVAVVGLSGEANPLIRWALEQGLLAYTSFNLGAVILAAGCFAALSRVVRSIAPPYDRWFERGLQFWLGLLLLAGVAVFANNLLVIIHA